MPEKNVHQVMEEEKERLDKEDAQLDEQMTQLQAKKADIHKQRQAIKAYFSALESRPKP